MRNVLAIMMINLIMTIGNAQEITVSAASSLTNAFKDIARTFETQHPETKIALNFGGSGTLLQQIASGAPVDVFASADQATMDKAEKNQYIDQTTRQNFAANTLVLIVPNDSTLAITQLGDLRHKKVTRIAVGNPASVPVGSYTQQALKAATLWEALTDKIITTQNVRQSLDYVARGEVDAGFVYATDAKIMQDKVKVVLTVPLPVRIDYPIANIAKVAKVAKVTKSAQDKTAQDFIAYILSRDGQAILKTHGFDAP